MNDSGQRFAPGNLCPESIVIDVIRRFVINYTRIIVFCLYVLFFIRNESQYGWICLRA